MTSWLEELLGEAVLNNLTNMVAIVNEKVGTIASDISQTPANFSPSIYNMIRTISENVIVPIAGIILTIIACYELIQLIIEHNNLQHFETWIFLKWIFKTYIAIYLISNTFTIVMAVFDVAQYVVNQSTGLITGSTSLSPSMLDSMRTAVQSMGAGELFGLYIELVLTLQFTAMIRTGLTASPFKLRQNIEEILYRKAMIATRCGIRKIYIHLIGIKSLKLL